MASSNPFRKKSPQASDRFPPIDAIDTSAAIADVDQGPESPVHVGLGAADDRGNATKITKKVRILSPPPLSPDSPDWPGNAPALAPPSQSQSDARFSTASDPFTNVSDSHIDTSATPPLRANPFGKTLQDLEHSRLDAELQQERREEGAALKLGNVARKSLDVSSFHRLLMTGNADLTESPSSGSSIAGETTSQTVASAEAPAPTHTQLPTATSHLSSTTGHFEDQGGDEHVTEPDASINVQIESRSPPAKKPAPPPPSSRHGNRLASEPKDDTLNSPPTSTVSPPSDINKPLPQPPAHNELYDEAESPFDREAAGKVPEYDTLPQQLPPAKKSVPAPPPRRGHARGDTKTHLPNVQETAQVDGGDDDGSSIGEGRSRSSSLRSLRRGAPAPAPPPPRRPGTTISRQNTPLSPAIPSPGAGSMSAEIDQISAHATAPESAQVGTPASTNPSRGAGPPPPPARNTSVRRPPSLHSTESGSRRVSFDGKTRESHGPAPPPPAPRRQRGSSRSSVEGPPARSSDAAARPRSMMAHVPRDLSTPEEPTSPGQGVDILADLTALQREVDALRGKLT